MINEQELQFEDCIKAQIEKCDHQIVCGTPVKINDLIPDWTNCTVIQVETLYDQQPLGEVYSWTL